MIFAGPGIPSGKTCQQPAELLDIYPTLTGLTGLPQAAGQEGLSLQPQIESPDTLRQRPAICTHNAGNHSVCDNRWRYIRYADGAEELYDRSKDPQEYANLLSHDKVQPAHRAVANRLAEWLPTDELPLWHPAVQLGSWRSETTVFIGKSKRFCQRTWWTSLSGFAEATCKARVPALSEEIIRLGSRVFPIRLPQ